MASRNMISKMLVILRANWPTYELTPETPRVYEEFLADIPDDLLELAVKDCVARLTYFPRIAELREAAHAILEDRLGIPTATEAWGAVANAVRYGRPERRPDFSPEIRRAIDAVGGWYHLCTSDTFAADRARFLDAYREIVQREREERRQLPEVRAAAARLRIAAGERQLRLVSGGER